MYSATESKVAVTSILTCLLLAVAGCGPSATKATPLAITGRTMGTTYSVKIAALPDGKSLDDVKTGIEKELETVNQQMSTWRKNSEISRFNAATSTGWFAVSPETVTVIREAIRISRLSGGAFDVTVGPLVNLWSFGPEARPKAIPTDADIAKRKQRVGYQLVKTRDDPPAMRKSRSDIAVDLSAIAKGFGVDQVAAYLDSLGIGGYMVEIGGEVRCKGTKSNGSDWVIGIQSPKTEQTELHRKVTLRNAAMATSGDYRNYFEKDGKRYSHTIDPRTGRPIFHKLVSVSVIAENCMTADAAATAIMVLGPDAGYNFAEKNNFAVLLLIADGDKTRERITSDFQKRLRQ